MPTSPAYRTLIALSLALALAALLVRMGGLDQSGFLALNALAAQILPEALPSSLTLLGHGLVAVMVLAPFLERAPGILLAGLYAAPIGGLLSWAGKRLAATARPGAVLDAASFHVQGPLLTGHNSFPSGHSITAFLVFSVLVLGLRAGTKGGATKGSAVAPAGPGVARGTLGVGVGLALLALALLVAASRVMVGAHWPSDTLGGGALGIIAGLLGTLAARRWPLWQRARAPLVLACLVLACALVLARIDTGYPLARPLQWFAVALGLGCALRTLLRQAYPQGVDLTLLLRYPSPRAGAALLAGVTGLLLLPSLGLYPLFDVDEGAFSEATRELLASGDWLSTTLNGAPRYDKPILIYWLQALSVAGLGLNEFALRLPSALAGMAWVAAVVHFAIPRQGSRAGLLAGWIAATSLGVMAMSRAATADALLNALLAALMLDLWRHLESGNRWALRRTFLWMALGMLTKGPIAILIPLAVSLLYCLSARRGRDWLRASLDPVGLVILVAVAGPWYAAQLLVHGREFIDGFLVRHNLERFHGTLEGHSGSLFYYVLVGPVLLLPWSGLLWRSVRRAGRDWSDPLSRYLLLWFGFVLVFFSLSGTKLPHYLLYGMTPLFLLLARRLQDSGTGRNLLVLPALLALALPLAPTFVQWLAERSTVVPTPFYLAQAQRAAALAGPGYYVLSLGTALLVLALALLRRQPAWARAVGASAALSVALGFAFVPWLGAVLNDPVRDAGALAATLPGTAVQWEFAAPSFSVYRGQSTPARPPLPGELAITRTDRLAPGAAVELLLREGGVALVRRLPEAAPTPAPAPIPAPRAPHPAAVPRAAGPRAQ